MNEEFAEGERMPVKKVERSGTDGNPGEKPPRGHVHEQVLRYMRRGLMVGAFLPGQVMSLRKLAAGLGTSPMPVREVLSRLVAASALEETKGGSVRVPRLGPEKLSDLFAVREMLEGMAVELAAAKATPALIDELAEVNKHLLIAIEKRDILNCLSLNQKFHFTLYEASGSEVLMPLIESLWLQFGPTMYMSLLIPSMPWNASDHEIILNALRENNVAAAKKGCVHDIRTTGKALLSVAGSQGIELPFANGLELQFDS
ncbi:GntR family transcriptional regulator [Nitratireductor pacificus]|uniref:GntR family transcriptional regulator n=1 Tax=Nitratireductor pacificus pht-3B TaxID=391937 RepID=K2M8W8_9HYPH|nr:GntR family transcriptional regulator [Nitratireductor pacificus]EKF17475.1 GntR family transcriptional regulator [Nitratireductor pacificus pht-3B]